MRSNEENGKDEIKCKKNRDGDVVDEEESIECLYAMGELWRKVLKIVESNENIIRILMISPVDINLVTYSVSHDTWFVAI